MYNNSFLSFLKLGMDETGEAVLGNRICYYDDKAREQNRGQTTEVGKKTDYVL